MNRGQRELEIINAVAEELNRSPDVRQALERTLALVASLLRKIVRERRVELEDDLQAAAWDVAR